MNTSSEDIIRFLSEGRTKFSYTKANGEMREAIGTTNVDLIPEGSRAQANNTPEREIISYFDLDKNDWRSFRVEGLKPESVSQS